MFKKVMAKVRLTSLMRHVQKSDEKSEVNLTYDGMFKKVMGKVRLTSLMMTFSNLAATSSRY